MVFGGQIFALGVIFWGIQGHGQAFTQGDTAVHRLMARDVSFELTDCGTEEYYCLEDRTGFQIVIPMDIWTVDRWPHGEIYTETNRYTYRMVHVNVGPFLQGRSYTMSRQGPDGRALLYQISRDCGVSYLEFSAAELPNLYDESVPAISGFYLSRCEGRGE